MTGSTLAVIVIPVVATTSLTAWLILVAAADRQPQPGNQLGRGRWNAGRGQGAASRQRNRAL